MIITKKQLASWKVMDKEWPSFNDSYNKMKYGLTLDQYSKISKVIRNLKGICGDFPTLEKINQQLTILFIDS